jgi:hypothetical protein
MFIVLFTGPEYGTTEAAYKAILVESDRRCDLHVRVKEDLNFKAINQLKQWQKENYHKVYISNHIVNPISHGCGLI